MTQEVVTYDPAVVDRAIAILHAEHAATSARAGNRLTEARALAIRGDIEPLSGSWVDDDRFWVRSQHSNHRYMVITGKHPRCDCPDCAQHGVLCKHILAVSLICLARFRLAYVPALEQDVREFTDTEGSEVQDQDIREDTDEEDIVARAIQDLEAYAQRQS